MVMLKTSNKPPPAHKIIKPSSRELSLLPLDLVNSDFAPELNGIGFLDLPYELRLEIYELLLLSPDPIIISPKRRQLHVRRESPPKTSVYLRAPRPNPRVVVPSHRKPHTALLRTNKQINHEATPILYSKNKFATGVFVRRGDESISANDVTGFLFWRMRQSTLLQIPSVTFSPACLCTQWIIDSFNGHHDWTISGPALAKMCFRFRTKDGYLVPATSHAKDALSTARTEIHARQRQSGRVVGFCRRCYTAHDQIFLL